MAAKRDKGDVIAPKERRLGDFWRIGKEVTFEDPQEEGTELKLWVQKLSPAEEKIAVTKARPAKAVVAAIKRLPEDSDEKFYYYDQLDSDRFSTLRKKQEYIVANDVAEFASSAQEELAASDEWAKEDYLVGLNAAWNDGLKEKYALDPEDEEASRVYKELERFTQEVDESVAQRENELIYEIQDLSEEEIDKKVVRKLIEDESVSEMFNEFRNQQLYLATRYNDKRDERYFESADEVAVLPFEPKVKLLAAYMEVDMSGIEGKG